MPQPEPIRIDGFGDIGLVTDRYPFELPQNAFSDAKDVLFRDGAAEAGQPWDHIRTLFDPCYFVTWHQSRSNEKRWFLANLTNAYAYDANGIHQIGTGLGGLGEMAWSSCAINGQLILTNGVDDLYYWDGEDLTGTGLAALPNWPAGQTAGTLCSFKNHVLAANLLGTITDPFAVWWSHPADPTASPPVPPNWDYTDPTSDSGIAYLAQEGGQIQLMLKLRDTVIVYRESASHILRYVGGTFILGFNDYMHTVGCLGPHSACKIQGQRHFVVTRDDIIVHDGQTMTPIAEDRIREDFFGAINDEYIDRVYCVADHSTHDVWVCFPSASSEWATLAYVWNWDDNTWTKRELSGTTFLSYGEFMEEATGVWEAWSDVPNGVSWEDMTGKWDIKRYTAAKGALMSLGGAGYNMEWLNTYNPQYQVPFDQRLERLGLNLTGDENVSMVTAVYLHLRVDRATADNPLLFYIGSQNGPMDDSVTWEGPFTLTELDSEDDSVNPYRVTCRVSGRRHAIKILSNNAKWRLTGMDFLARPVGGR